MSAARWKMSAAFELFSKLGVPFYCFHDRDIAPEGTSFKESCAHVVSGERGARESDPNQWWDALRAAVAMTGRGRDIRAVSVAGRARRPRGTGRRHRR